jgi:putative acetyltransferase
MEWEKDMEISIRHAEDRDAASVHDIMVSSHVVAGSMRLPYQPLSYVQKRLATENGVYKLVAVCGEEVVGYCELVTHPDNPRHAHAGEINMIITAAHWQGKGIGRALMQAMVDLADEWLRLTRLGLVVWTTNAHAIRLYESFGFKIEGTMPAFVFARGVFIDAYMMGRVKA